MYSSSVCSWAGLGVRMVGGLWCTFEMTLCRPLAAAPLLVPVIPLVGDEINALFDDPYLAAPGTLMRGLYQFLPRWVCSGVHCRTYGAHLRYHTQL